MSASGLTHILGLDPGVGVATRYQYGDAMLTVTDAAAEAITSLVTKNQMPEGSGLRISRQSDTTRSEGLGLSIAKAPAEDEFVLESNGVKVFLTRALSDVLQKQELHVQRSTEDGEEKLNFTVEQKPKPQQ